MAHGGEARERRVGETTGVLIAIASSSLGGTAAAVTRYLVGNADAITLAILRWGIGFLCVLPVALGLRVHWPPRADWPAVAALGVCYFGLFFVLYNIAMSYTTAARASLALSTLPLQTMVVAALLGIEHLTPRKTAGVLIAMLGVFAALASGPSAAPSGAWRGELIMTGSLTGRIAVLATFGAADWIAGIYLGLAGGALAFILWVLALQKASPTRVANTMTVNPIAAGLLAVPLVGEPITAPLIMGLIAVLAGIWIATTPSRRSA
jgi:drug/metabolite transporter (DMT)-like permease